MSEQPQLVTVYRSAEHTALEEASSVLDLLVEAGLDPALFTDDHPGVPQGVCEVRVPASEEESALTLIEEAAAEQVTDGDSSSAMDLVDIYQGVGTSAEVEAISVRAVLDANHIPNVLSGGAEMPNLPFAVKVPYSYEEAALQALEDARAGGPAAADAEAAGQTA